ncbi:LysR substrate-binding domain-containing protein [uncultured Roseobacter sp.]|uniref:LysR substrate-binding domain-containing protein n=1 Tax=uncultured Roseobacter sp. TaxID=114847 RepID=UPI00261935B9|nr:LysR substrate-binding domain-containing protein [uncultured Roseobacter sp.]
MELRHFRIFIVLAEELHFGRTAYRLNTAQPVISKTLRDIEDEVGTTLIERSSRQAALTPAGRAFLVSAKEALAQAENAINAARSSTYNGLDRLRLGLTIGAAQPWVGRIVARFKAENPEASVSILELDETTLGRALAEDIVDAAIAWDRSIPGGLSTLKVGKVDMQVFVPEDHALAQRNAVTMEDLQDQPMILPSRAKQPVLFETYKRYCTSVGFNPRIAAEVATTADLLALVAGGVGIGHAPIPDGLSYPSVKILPQTPAFSLGFELVWSRKTPIVSALTKITKGLTEEGREG